MAITYVEKGNSLHVAISEAGYRLIQRDGEWVVYPQDAEAAVQAIIDSHDPIPHEAVIAKALIDTAAGAARARYITVAPGQEATYQIKEAAARRYVADGTLSPLLTKEAEATGQTVDALAATIIATADQWITLAASIESIRMGAKAAVSAVVDWTQCAQIAQQAVAQLDAI